MKMNPAEYVIYKFGGVSKAAVALGMSRFAVHHWKTRSGGRIPSVRQSLILDVAKRDGIDIMSSDLVYGRMVKVRRPAPIRELSDH